MRVENMTSARGNLVPNQFVITDDFRVTFQSYKSTIIEVDYEDSVVTVGRDWNYSNTTGKYRNLFFENYVGYALHGLSDRKTLEEAMKNGSYNGFRVERA